MTDGDEPFKPVLLKAEVPKHVSEKLDEMAKDMGFSTRAKLIRHIIADYLAGPKVTFSDFERMDPGQGFRGQAAQDMDMSELTAVLHTLNKSMDQSAAQLNIISRQNETIHKLVDQNEKLTQNTLWGNERPALPERSQATQEQDQTRTEVVEDGTEPLKDSPKTEQAGTEMGTTEEPPRTQDKQPLPGGETVDVPGAVKMGRDLGVSYSVDTVRRAVKEGILIAVPDHSPMLVYVRDVRAFAETYQKYGKLPKMPQIRDGKALE